MTISHDYDDERDDLEDFIEEQSDSFRAALEDAEARSELVRHLLAERRSQRLTQTAVAAAMGTSQSAISELEGGDNNDQRFSTLQRYARAVGCKIECWVVPV